MGIYNSCPQVKRCGSNVAGKGSPAKEMAFTARAMHHCLAAETLSNSLWMGTLPDEHMGMNAGN